MFVDVDDNKSPPLAVNPRAAASVSNAFNNRRMLADDAEDDDDGEGYWAAAGSSAPTDNGDPQSPTNQRASVISPPRRMEGRLSGQKGISTQLEHHEQFRHPDEHHVDVDLYTVRVLQAASDCIQLEVPSKPLRYLLLSEGPFQIRLESSSRAALIAKLEIDGRLAKSNYRILPGGTHTIRETRGGNGMNAVPLRFVASPAQKEPFEELEDIDAHTGTLRVMFYAVGDTSRGKWEILSNTPEAIVALRYGFADPFARFFGLDKLAIPSPKRERAKKVAAEKNEGRPALSERTRALAANQPSLQEREAARYQSMKEGNVSAQPPSVSNKRRVSPVSRVSSRSSTGIRQGQASSTSSSKHTRPSPTDGDAYYPADELPEEEHPCTDHGVDMPVARHRWENDNDTADQQHVCLRCSKIFVQERLQYENELERLRNKVSELQKRLVREAKMGQGVYDRLYARYATPTATMRAANNAGAVAEKQRAPKQRAQRTMTPRGTTTTSRASNTNNYIGETARSRANNANNNQKGGIQMRQSMASASRWDNAEAHVTYRVHGETIVTSPAKEGAQHDDEGNEFNFAEHPASSADASPENHHTEGSTADRKIDHLPRMEKNLPPPPQSVAPQSTVQRPAEGTNDALLLEAQQIIEEERLQRERAQQQQHHDAVRAAAAPRIVVEKPVVNEPPPSVAATRAAPTYENIVPARREAVAPASSSQRFPSQSPMPEPASHRSHSPREAHESPPAMHPTSQAVRVHSSPVQIEHVDQQSSPPKRRTHGAAENPNPLASLRGPAGARVGPGGSSIHQSSIRGGNQTSKSRSSRDLFAAPAASSGVGRSGRPVDFFAQGHGGDDLNEEDVEDLDLSPAPLRPSYQRDYFAAQPQQQAQKHQAALDNDFSL